jgi:hypothetical protein
MFFDEGADRAACGDGFQLQGSAFGVVPDLFQQLTHWVLVGVVASDDRGVLVEPGQP